MASPLRNTGKVQREWLNKVLADIGATPSALAKRIGAAPSTLLRFLDAPTESPRTLHASTVDKIVAVTGYAPPEVAGGGSNQRIARGLRADGVPFIAGEHPEGAAIEAALRVLSGSRNASEGWTLKSRSLETAGLLPGAVLMVDLDRQPQAGDIVYAEIRDDHGKTTETTFRYFEPPYLVAASQDPALRKPMLVDNERVVILGVVTHELRTLKVA